MKKKLGIFIFFITVVVLIIALTNRHDEPTSSGGNSDIVEPVKPKRSWAIELPTPDVAQSEVDQATYKPEFIPDPQNEVEEALQEIEPPTAQSSPTIVNIPGDRPLATVNNVPVMLNNLFAIKPENVGASVQLEKDEYQALLERAIESEVTFQAALNEGVTLTPEQEAMVKSIGERKRADVEANREQGLMWSSVTEDQIAFQERYVESLLLLRNLQEKEGLPTTPVLSEDQVRQYYEQHKDVYGELPSDSSGRDEAWQKINQQIVNTLFPYLNIKYEEQNRQFLDDLLNQADVVFHDLDKTNTPVMAQ